MAADQCQVPSLFKSTPASRRTARNNEVLVYCENDAPSFRAFKLHFRAYVDTKGWLGGLGAVQDKAAWCAANKYDATKEPETTQAAYKVYKEKIEQDRRECYNALVLWPGVTTPRVMDLMEQEFEVSRDGRGLLAKLAAHASYATPERQAKVKSQLSKMHAIAHSESVDPRINTLTLEEFSDLLEAWWHLWTLSDANVVADAHTYITTALSFILKIDKLRFTAELKQSKITESGAVPKPRDFIDSMLVRRHRDDVTRTDVPHASYRTCSW